MKTYKGKIVKLKDNQIFVFGSNTQGRHGAGAAKFALDNCGAIYGKSKGRQGNSYAIITKDLTKNVHPSISPSYIKEQIRELYEYAKINPNLDFLIIYSGNGINLNGYSNQEMAEFFSSVDNIPSNIIFEEEFIKLF